MRAVAAASGGSASMQLRRQAMQRLERGLMSLTATGLPSLQGSVKCQFLFKARQGGPE